MVHIYCSTSLNLASDDFPAGAVISFFICKIGADADDAIIHGPHYAWKDRKETRKKKIRRIRVKMRHGDWTTT